MNIVETAHMTLNLDTMEVRLQLSEGDEVSCGELSDAWAEIPSLLNGELSDLEEKAKDAERAAKGEAIAQRVADSSRHNSRGW